MTRQKRDYYILTKLNKTPPPGDLKVVVIGMRCLSSPTAGCHESAVYPSWQRQGFISCPLCGRKHQASYIYKNSTQWAHPLDVNLVHVHLHLVYIWSFDTVTGTAQLVMYPDGSISACMQHLNAPSSKTTCLVAPLIKSLYITYLFTHVNGSCLYFHL